ncbi:MAG: hypothetical protein AAGH43_06055 [Pseudomonadota bacterium]
MRTALVALALLLGAPTMSTADEASDVPRPPAQESPTDQHAQNAIHAALVAQMCDELALESDNIVAHLAEVGLSPEQMDDNEFRGLFVSGMFFWGAIAEQDERVACGLGELLFGNRGQEQPDLLRYVGGG